MSRKQSTRWASTGERLLRRFVVVSRAADSSPSSSIWPTSSFEVPWDCEALCWLVLEENNGGTDSSLAILDDRFLRVLYKIRDANCFALLGEVVLHYSVDVALSNRNQSVRKTPLSKKPEQNSERTTTIPSSNQVQRCPCLLAALFEQLTSVPKTRRSIKRLHKDEGGKSLLGESGYLVICRVWRHLHRADKVGALLMGREQKQVEHTWQQHRHQRDCGAANLEWNAL